MTFQDTLDPAISRAPRARGDVAVSVKRRGRASVIDGLRQAGSLKVLFPRASGDGLDAALVNTAGGITGGDRFSFCATAGPDTTLTLTTQAAERAYRAQPMQTGRVRNRLEVGPGARLNWLPQETILFEAAALHRRLDVNLAADATLLLCEPVIFGRAAMGEVVRHLRWSDDISLHRAGQLVYLDKTGFDGDISAHMARRTTGRGALAMATVLYVHPGAEAQRDVLAGLIGRRGGVTCLAPDMLVMRLLGDDGFDLRCTLVPILMRLLGRELPRPWMI